MQVRGRGSVLQVLELLPTYLSSEAFVPQHYGGIKVYAAVERGLGLNGLGDTKDTEVYLPYFTLLLWTGKVRCWVFVCTVCKYT